MKELLSKVIPSSVWSALRSKKIVKHHAEVALICEKFIGDYYQSGVSFPELLPKKSFDTDKIIWQFWAQGYDNVPPVVKECLDSVDRWAGEYTVIRLTKNNFEEYIQFPEFFLQKIDRMSIAHFADVLRLCLLSVYGGVWMDATIMLSAPIPQKYKNMDFFVYQRDSSEQNKRYWSNTYAYYFGWQKGFRVNMLNSIIFAHKQTKVITDLSNMMLYYWKGHDSLPDYFFFQILFDVLMNGRLQDFAVPIESDCKPHYLQQLKNDQSFFLASKEEILSTIPIHKLTYK